MDEAENIPTNPTLLSGAVTMADVVRARLAGDCAFRDRLSRRGFLIGAGAVVLAGCASTASSDADDQGEARFSFPEIARGSDGTHHVPEGYVADILLRWGDALFADAPPFDPYAQSAAAQARQFGYNNDFVGLVLLAPTAQGHARALLCVNHEYTSTHLMFPALRTADGFRAISAEECAVEMAAHGGSVVEIVRTGAGWAPVVGSRFNRRIMADGTPMLLTGPAAGHPRLRTSADPEGRIVQGTMNNCAGGITPWGTYLMAEENFNLNFDGVLPAGHAETANHARYGVPGSRFQWARHYPRFDIGQEPNEPNRFGWVVEVDPLDPASVPRKRTALGRCKHEGAESVIAPDGRLVLYMGDDQAGEHVYKFITARALDPLDRQANMDLLDEGTLYAARFDADGRVTWLPLVHGSGLLVPGNGFASQADVLIETRRAASALGATPMDRPEDVEPNAQTGRVYVMLTNNGRRDASQTDAANPRGPNPFGHIIEIIEPDGDFAALSSRWDMLVRCGDPADPAVQASWSPQTSENGWFGSPDNCAVDPAGRLWIATDGNDKTRAADGSRAADGLWALETEGSLRGTGRAFFRAPVGAELCGPRFTDDAETLFVAVQHPGDGAAASFETPTTRWPDNLAGRPPRPSVVAVRRKDGGRIGG